MFALPTIPRRGRRWLAAATALLALVIAACSPKTAMVPQLAPETSLFVQGDIDTVSYHVHLYWFGTDADGDVTGFEIRLLDPQKPADTAWVFTTKTDSLFAMYTPDGASSPTLEVRAIDNDGHRDPTPATQQFHFTNLAPFVTIGPYPVASDTTFASLTFAFVGVDPDGDANKMSYRVWLDGNEANPHLVTSRTFTVPSADFMVNDTVKAGPRTVFVQPIDDGNRAGAVVSRTWNVRPTVPDQTQHPRLLLIDDYPQTATLNTQADTLWNNAAVRTYSQGSIAILRLEKMQPFRSNEDIRQTFSLYDAVAWYRGDLLSFQPLLRNYQTGIGQAIDSGHSFVVEGLNLVEGLSSNGPIQMPFVSQYYDTDYLFKYFESGQEDSSVEWGVNTGTLLRNNTTDYLRIAGIYRGLRGFAVHDTNSVFLWADPGDLSQGNDYASPVALLVPQSSGAKAGIISVPVVAGWRTTTQFPQHASALLNKLFSDLKRAGLVARNHSRHR